MIRTFRDAATAAVFEGHRPRRVSPEIMERAHRILRVLHGAHALADLKGKSYGAHRLTGDRAGEW